VLNPHNQAYLKGLVVDNKVRARQDLGRRRERQCTKEEVVVLAHVQVIIPANVPYGLRLDPGGSSMGYGKYLTSQQA
jgi:hypothetical protein